MTYNDKIQAIRKASGLTQSQFAKLIGVARGTIAQIEAGNSKPTIDIINKIVNKFNIEYDYIFNKEIKSFNTNNVHLNVHPNVHLNDINNIEEPKADYAPTREEIKRLGERIRALEEKLQHKHELIHEKEQRIKELNKYIALLESYNTGQDNNQKRKTS